MVVDSLVPLVVVGATMPGLLFVGVIQLVAMSVSDARAIADWRYEPPYDFYDGSEAEISVMLDPVNWYRSIRASGEFVGYVCVGPDARVAGQLAVPEIDDIGWGFRPDLTGRGIASGWLPDVLELLDGLAVRPKQRVVIAAWNERSQAVARRLGFVDAGSLDNELGRWVELERRVTPACEGRS